MAPTPEADLGGVRSTGEDLHGSGLQRQRAEQEG